ncbi:hypothetical protein CROQUDRAFT_97157 [Cronartium quercuum f. sp. fusiforme G11]|uniref:Uncharacterized protein n=1 Tax=Cronartium quercuum f. sp. fusiforme G11 TaxID=708437 RepID=A0A9P6NEJ6_9BASI|nr:hypothetical protein CROQUDRAFT_97157 [Cronartium quercuum f. sp. fusiforme G11]
MVGDPIKQEEAEVRGRNVKRTKADYPQLCYPRRPSNAKTEKSYDERWSVGSCEVDEPEATTRISIFDLREVVRRVGERDRRWLKYCNGNCSTVTSAWLFNQLKDTNWGSLKHFGLGIFELHHRQSNQNHPGFSFRPTCKLVESLDVSNVRSRSSGHMTSCCQTPIIENASRLKVVTNNDILRK